MGAAGRTNSGQQVPSWHLVPLRLFPALFLVLAVLVFTLPGAWREAAKLGAGLLCPMSLVLGVWLFRPVDPRPLWFALAGQLLWFGGAILRSHTKLTGSAPHIWFIDGPLTWEAILCAVGYVPFAIGLYLFGSSGGRRRTLETHIDTALLTLGLGMLSVVWVIQPVIAADLSFAATVRQIAYPVADIGLLAALMGTISIPGKRTTSLRLVMLGVVLLLVNDTIDALPGISGPLETVSYAIWFGSLVVVVMSPLHPSIRELGTATLGPARMLGGARTILLTLALLSAPIVVVLGWITRDGLGAGTAMLVGVVGLLTALLVLARIGLILRRLREQAVAIDRAARTDHLTGLPNRRVVDQLLAERLSSSQVPAEGTDPRPETVCVAILDLDHFKRVNDECGHQVGDQLLAEAAAAWQARLSTLNGMAHLGRYGGEEFLLFTRGLSLVAAEELLADLHRLTPMHQTFSAGLAQWDGLETAGRLMSRADNALYTAKAEGRARTVVAGDPQLGHEQPSPVPEQVGQLTAGGL